MVRVEFNDFFLNKFVRLLNITTIHFWHIYNTPENIPHTHLQSSCNCILVQEYGPHDIDSFELTESSFMA